MTHTVVITSSEFHALKFKKLAIGSLAILAVAGVAYWFSLDKETRGLLATVPTNRDILFWTESQRDAAFRALDRLPIVIQYNKRDLPNAAPVEYLEYLFNNRPTPFLSFESDARSGRNVLATLNAISQAVLHQFRLRTAPADSTSATPHELPTHALAA